MGFYYLSVIKKLQICSLNLSFSWQLSRGVSGPAVLRQSPISRPSSPFTSNSPSQEPSSGNDTPSCLKLLRVISRPIP